MLTHGNSHLSGMDMTSWHSSSSQPTFLCKSVLATHQVQLIHVSQNSIQINDNSLLHPLRLFTFCLCLSVCQQHKYNSCPRIFKKFHGVTGCVTSNRWIESGSDEAHDADRGTVTGTNSDRGTVTGTNSDRGTVTGTNSDRGTVMGINYLKSS